MIGQAARDVEDRLFAALAVLRAVMVVNTVVMTVLRWDNFQHRSAAALVVGLCVVWSGAATWLYASPVRRRTWVFRVDMGVALGSLLLSPVIKGAGFHAAMLSFWIAAPLLACAVRWYAPGGAIAGFWLGAVDLSVRQELTTNETGNVFLLVLAGLVVGHLSGTVQRMAEERAAAEREAAAATERTRLARAVHDGVLQVLALAQRRGAEAGGEWAELGRVAGAQEVSLRAMIRAQDHVPGAPRIRAHPTASVAARAGVPVDLAGRLEEFSSATVTVATPGRPVLLPAHTVEEIAAAVGQALANVEAHVGAGAPAWLLVEDAGGSVSITVRDEGPGFDLARLAQAEQEGRLGVASSIRGRIHDLGGTAEVTSDRWGTEWEFTVPRDLPPSSR